VTLNYYNYDKLTPVRMTLQTGCGAEVDKEMIRWN
jgi:hypothetical protein